MLPRRFFSQAIVLLLALLLTPSVSAQRGALTAQRNLAELTNRAEVILRGQIVSAKFEKHPELRNLDTVLVSLRVHEVLKGSAPATYTFRQYIWDMRDRFNLAGYRKGEQLLLLMNKPSRFGLSSPVGLEQGRFRIVRGAGSTLMASNGRGNAGLFTGLPAQLAARKVALSPRTSKMLHTRHGAVPVDELSELIRALVGKK